MKMSEFNITSACEEEEQATRRSSTASRFSDRQDSKKSLREEHCSIIALEDNTSFLASWLFRSRTAWRLDIGSLRYGIRVFNTHWQFNAILPFVIVPDIQKPNLKQHSNISLIRSVPRSLLGSQRHRVSWSISSSKAKSGSSNVA